MRFVKPMDENMLREVFDNYDKILVIEEGSLMGGFGSAVLEYAQQKGYMNKVIERLGLEDAFFEHGSTEELKIIAGLGDKKIEETIQKLIGF
jgi:1-deoxy-D-xylulose-5-phosphate synthase